MKCKCCGDDFVEASKDPEWTLPDDGRCADCSEFYYLDGLYTMYGGIMEPMFTVGGRSFTADGEFDNTPYPPEEHRPPQDIPF